MHDQAAGISGDRLEDQCAMQSFMATMSMNSGRTNF
jgi:hypothetical protein